MIQDQHWLLREKYGGKETDAYERDLARLASDEPVAYVIGSQPFLELSIRLDSRPLIPRVETEWWTNELLNSLLGEAGAPASGVGRGLAARSAPDASAPAKPIRFLDLCSGSGAIGCAALARLANATVYFGELDPSHEATIRANIRENGLDASRAMIGIGDLFAPFPGETFDVIASNPPYVPVGRDLPPSVARYEPPRALFAGEDGLAVIRRIAAELPRRLARDGVAWIEVDRGHAEAAAELFRDQGFSCEIRTDQYGKPRLAVVSWPQ